jgi:transcriptional regulator of aroF, aroG, tyrA and aromatic amino acid transport
VRKGILELATKGTCYLSRIEELTPGLQLGLLRFLSSHRVRRLGDGKEVSSGVRLMVSSDKNLAGLVESGLFDRELYTKLSVLSLQLRPVRKRSEDILRLVEYCVRTRSVERASSRRLVLADDAVSALAAYPWPGNFDEIVREVERLVDSGATVVHSQTLSTEISTYWLGQHCDPEVRKVLEELDGYIREFRILSRLEADLGEPSPSITGWGDECCHQRDPLEEF